jgi:O-antigen/teichoic acid export membrane protein
MQQRRKFLVVAGLVCIVAFIILRYFNIYGDPHPWKSGKNFIYSVMAILRTTKYPVSLLYALMTLGPALLVLGLIEPVRNKFTGFFVTIGSVPMFYYILHLPAFVVLGFIFGFNKYDLGTMYLFYGGVVLILYLLCGWYSKYKFSHPEQKWLRYL